MNDDLLALATEIMDWHDCADGDVDAGNGHFRLVCLNDSEQQRLNLRAVLREAASAIRLAAQSPEPVAVKPLEWNEYTDERGDPDRWDAETLAGTYYGVALLVDGFSVEYDYTAVAKGLHDLDAAKAAAQDHYEQRIRSAIVNAPVSASTTGRQALNEVVTNGKWTEGDQCGEWKISKAVYDLAVEARDSILAASEATKSDVEAPAATTVERPGTVTSESEPSTSDTAPLDFSTVEIDRDFYFTWPNGAHKTSPELLALLERAKNHVMTPEEVYEQRRSFVRGMCPSNRDYGEWCEQVDRLIPPLPVPSDTRPADVTAEVRALIEFVQSVFDFYNEGHSMPMWIGRDARALLDTYKIGAK